MSAAPHPFDHVVPANDGNAAVIRVAQALMIERSAAAGEDCWTGGYPGRACNGMALCRCANEAEAEARAFLRHAADEGDQA